MAPTIPCSPPDRIVAGDTVQWTVPPDAARDFPTSEGWTIRARLLGPSTLEADAVVSGPTNDAYLVTFAATDTKHLRSGLYRLVCSAHSGAFRYQVGDVGRVVVAPDPAATHAGEAVSFAERMVTQLQSLYTRVVADPLAEYTFGDRAAKRYTPAEVRTELAMWTERLQQERRGGRLRQYVATTRRSC